MIPVIGLIVGGFVAYYFIGVIIAQLMRKYLPEAFGAEFGSDEDTESGELLFAVLLWPINLIYIFFVLLNRFTMKICGIK